MPDERHKMNNLDEEHVVDFAEDRFAIQHPLRERTELDSLLDCPLHALISGFEGCPVEETGRYLVVGWTGPFSSSVPRFEKL